jgi:hypothetical protein
MGGRGVNRDELAAEVRSVAGEGMTMTAAESVVDRLFPLIEADVQERIATEIEAMTLRGADNRIKHASSIRNIAARIARGADQ